MFAGLLSLAVRRVSACLVSIQFNAFFASFRNTAEPIARHPRALQRLHAGPGTRLRQRIAMISHRITGASLSRVACTARAALGAGYAALPSGSAATNAVAQRPRRPPCCSHRPVLPSPQGAGLSQRRWAHRAAASTPRVAPRPGAKPGGAGNARRPAAAAQSSADSAAAREDGEGDGLGELKARVEALERDHEELGRRGKREAWRLQLIHKRQEAKAARSTSDRPHPHAKQWDHFFDHTARTS